MKHGHKATTTKMWNEGFSERAIADKLNIPEDDVVSFLKGKRNYPHGPITTRDQRVSRDRKAYMGDDAEFTKYGVTPKPTLPKLKFMGES